MDEASTPFSLSPPPAPRGTLSILLVDDDSRNLLMLNAVLEGLDARLVSARSGTAALRALLDQDFALILLDVRMPGMDGFETAALVRQRPRNAHTPIIFVTGNDATAASMQQGYKVGAVDYIVKPLDPHILRSKVSIFLELHRKSEEIVRQSEMLRLAEEREHERRLEALAAAERSRSEAEVRRLLERQALVLASVPLAVYTTAADGPSRKTAMSANAIHLTGFPAEAFTQDAEFWLKRVHPDDRALVDAWFESVRIEGRATCEYRWRCSDGRWRWFLDHGVLTRGSDGEMEIAGTWLDIEDRKRAEQALLVREEKLNVTLRSIADGVITTDPEGRVALMSRIAEALTGHLQGDVEGRLLADVLVLLDERTRDPVNLMTALGRPSSQAVGLLRHTDGSERLVHFHAAPIHAGSDRTLGLVLVFRDITDLRRRDEELFRASKLESIGVLAGGIAHDFNNLLTGVMASISVAEFRLTRGKPIGEAHRQALQACERARKLTQQLLTFARGGSPVKALLQVGEVVREAAVFALQGSRSRTIVEIDPDLWCVEVDAGQMGQVVQNLVLNADQAMPEGGTVHVTVENRASGPAGADGLVGPVVVIVVEDEGPGVPTEHLSKIFDPFYSTRPGGSGLGLATVYSIVQQHGGYVEVANPPGKGASFTVWIPATPGAAAAAPDAVRAAPVGGRGNVLVMDDEASVRDAAEAALELLGYQVTLTRDGAEVVERFEAALRAGTPYDVVLMDLTVPGGIGGLEATRRIHAIDPDVPVVVSTGYSTDPVVAYPEAHGFRGVIAKPWAIRDLDAALRRLLGERQSGDPAAGALTPRAG